MSFLLQEPARQNINQNGRESQFSMRGNRNSNAATGRVAGDSTRIFPRPGTKSFNRGNEDVSQQQVLGNQIMLQRQQCTNTTNKVQQQQEQQSGKQEHENLGDYTMDRVMYDLQILEQQQREAKRKLVSAQTTKQKRLGQQQQLNTLLENKSYSNGALREKLRQSHEFLSTATRNLGNRKLATERLQGGITEFERKLKRGLQSAKMIQICVAKVDSFLILLEHKATNVGRLKTEIMKVNGEVRKKYEQTEKRDRMLRLAIQDVHKRVHELGEGKVSLRIEMSKLDNDKMAAQNTEQSTELRIQSACDQIKTEMDRVATVGASLSNEIAEATKRKGKAFSEIDSCSTILQNLTVNIKVYREKINACKIREGHVTNAQAKDDDSPVFDQSVFRGDLARLEDETKKEEEELATLTKSIEYIEQANKKSNERTIQNANEAQLLISSAKHLTGEEENRLKHALKFKLSLEHALSEVTKLEQSFREMKENRGSEASTNSKAMSYSDVGLKQQTQVAETLKLKIKEEDISLKTKIRLFEDTDKPRLVTKLDEAKQKSEHAEKKYQDLIETSSEESIESKFHADFEQKFHDETMKWDCQSKKLICRQNEHLNDFPCLEKIDCTFNKDSEKDECINIALASLEKDCNARKATAEAIAEQRTIQMIERKIEAEAIAAKLKKKEQTQAKIKRRQLREESNRRVTNAEYKRNDLQAMNPLGDSVKDFIPSHMDDVFIRQQHRRRKGSEFFNPNMEVDDETDAVLTPTNPIRLVSAFLSQSSGQRVRWVDDGDVGNEDKNGDNDYEQEECEESHLNDSDQLGSVRNSHKRKIKQKTIFQSEYLSSKNLGTTNEKEQKLDNIKRAVETFEVAKKSFDGNSGPQLGRQRRRNDSNILNDGNIKRNRSKSRHLEADKYVMQDLPEQRKVDASQSSGFSTNVETSYGSNLTLETSSKVNFSNLKKKGRNRSSGLDDDNDAIGTTSPKSRETSSRVILSNDKAIVLRPKQQKTSARKSRDSRTILDSTGVYESCDRDRKIESRSIRENRSAGDPKRRSLSSHRSRKSNSKEIAQSSKEFNAAIKRPNNIGKNKDIEGKQSKRSYSSIRRKIDIGSIVVSSSKETSSARKSRRLTRTLDKKQLRNSDDRTLRDTHGEKGHVHEIKLVDDRKGEKRTSYTNGKAKDTKQREKRSEKSTDHVNHATPGNGQVKVSKIRSSRTRNKSTDKGAIPERRHPTTSANSARNTVSSTSKRRSTKHEKPASAAKEARLKDGKKSDSSIRERSKERSVQKESREKARKKLDSSNRGVNKQSRDSERFNGIVRETSSGERISKGNRKHRVKSSSDVREKKYVRAERTIAANKHLSEKASTGSGTKRNRNSNGDNMSVSTSNTALASRRRKRRSTGSSQKSTTTNIRDDACDFNF